MGHKRFSELYNMDVKDFDKEPPKDLSKEFREKIQEDSLRRRKRTEQERIKGSIDLILKGDKYTEDYLDKTTKGYYDI